MTPGRARCECSRAWEVEAAHDGRLGEMDLIRLERHITQCVECRSVRQNLQAVRAVARAVPCFTLTPLAVRRLRATLLQTAAQFDRQPASQAIRTTWIFAAAMALVGAVALWGYPRFVRSRTRQAATRGQSRAIAPTPLASVEPVGDGTWTRRVEPAAETVTLTAGTLRIHVPSQKNGHRFFVLTPDGEIEVRGTRFLVVVSAGHTERLEVNEGIVVWRPQGGGEQFFSAGKTWQRVVVPPTLAEAPARVAASAPLNRRPSGVRPALPHGPTRTISAFADALRAMDRGDFAAAAQGFEAFGAEFPDDERAEDAAYLRIVALRRADRHAAAERAALGYLTRYPRALRRWEAALLVARAARARGDCRAVTVVLEEFVRDSVRIAAVEKIRSGCQP